MTETATTQDGQHKIRARVEELLSALARKFGDVFRPPPATAPGPWKRAVGEAW
jgi:hypothetical protein